MKLYMRIITPILIDISAILNTGKFIKFKFIKSITYPLVILSNPLPIVPPNMKLQLNKSILFILFLFNIKYIQ